MSMLHIASKKTKSSLTNIKDDDIQPNAVDLRVDKIFGINFKLFTIIRIAYRFKTLVCIIF